MCVVHSGAVVSSVLRLTPRVGDGDRNSLNLDPVDADCLHGLSGWGELRRVQRYQASRWGDFR